MKKHTLGEWVRVIVLIVLCIVIALTVTYCPSTNASAAPAAAPTLHPFTPTPTPFPTIVPTITLMPIATRTPVVPEKGCKEKVDGCKVYIVPVLNGGGD